MLYQNRLLTTLLLACAVAAQAMPSLPGPTGTNVLPTAAVASTYIETPKLQILPSRGVTMQFAYDIFGNNPDADLTKSWRVLVSPNKALEAGFGMLTALDDTHGEWDGMMWNAKYRCYENARSAVAVGWRYAHVPDIGSQPEHVNQFSLVGTRVLWSLQQDMLKLNEDDAPSGEEVADEVDAEETAPVEPVAARKALNKHDIQVRGSLGANWTDLITDGSHDTSLRPFTSLEIGDARHYLSFDLQLHEEGVDQGMLYALGYRAGAFQIGVTNLSPTGVTAASHSTVFAGINF